MALIKCPECNQQISDQTETCIHCGYPINKRIDRSPISKENVQTIQETGKGLKLTKLIGVIILTLGAGGILVPPAEEISGYSVLALFIGAGIYFYGKFMTWWEHK